MDDHDGSGMSGEPLDHFAEAVERSAKDAERLMESVVKARCCLPATYSTACVPSRAQRGCMWLHSYFHAALHLKVCWGAWALMCRGRARAGLLRALRAQLLSALAAEAAVLVHQQRLHHLRPPHPHQRALGRPPHPGAPARLCLRSGRRSDTVQTTPVCLLDGPWCTRRSYAACRCADLVLCMRVAVSRGRGWLQRLSQCAWLA